jgi:hypothetical protein
MYCVFINQSASDASGLLTARPLAPFAPFARFPSRSAELIINS